MFKFFLFSYSDRKPVDKEDTDTISKGGCAQQATGWRKGAGLGYGHPGLGSSEEVKWFLSWRLHESGINLPSTLWLRMASLLFSLDFSTVSTGHES
jgi:hypothetical protein